jgi:hypothetical protein
LFLADKKPTDGLEWFLERIERAETMILDVRQLENSGTDSILDLGFSKLDHREKFRKIAAKWISIKSHFLDISKETRKRVMKETQKKRQHLNLKYPKKTLISWKLGLKNHLK